MPVRTQTRHNQQEDIMKRITSALIIISIILTAGTIAFGEQFELRGSGVSYMPSGSAATGSDVSALTDVKWDKGTGFEIQGIFWSKTSPWGTGISFGTATWDVDDYVLGQSINGFGFADALEGDADLTIFGLSLFRRLFTDDGASKKFSGAVEGGIRFISMDADIKGVSVITDGILFLGSDITLDIDNSVLGHLAFDLDYAISDSASLFVQGGIQFDLKKGDVTLREQDSGIFEAGDTELQAAFGKVGLIVHFGPSPPRDTTTTQRVRIDGDIKDYKARQPSPTKKQKTDQTSEELEGFKRKLEHFKDLHERGLISDSEYESLKAKAMATL